MVYEIKCPFCDEVNEWDGNGMLYCAKCEEFLIEGSKELKGLIDKLRVKKKEEKTDGI